MVTINLFYVRRQLFITPVIYRVIILINNRSLLTGLNVNEMEGEQLPKWTLAFKLNTKQRDIILYNK